MYRGLDWNQYTTTFKQASVVVPAPGLFELIDHSGRRKGMRLFTFVPQIAKAFLLFSYGESIANCGC